MSFKNSIYISTPRISLLMLNDLNKASVGFDAYVFQEQRSSKVNRNKHVRLPLAYQ